MPMTTRFYKLVHGHPHWQAIPTIQALRSRILELCNRRNRYVDEREIRKLTDSQLRAMLACMQGEE